METRKTLNAWPFKIRLDISLKDRERKAFEPQFLPVFKKPVFSISAMVRKNGAEYCGGQCREEIDEILKQYDAETVERTKIKYLRENYHLNDLHAWTPRQEKRLKSNGLKNWANDYARICEILKEHHLYADKGRKFGTGWNYWEIPAEDLKEIKSLFIG